MCGGGLVLAPESTDRTCRGGMVVGIKERGGNSKLSEGIEVATIDTKHTSRYSSTIIAQLHMPFYDVPIVLFSDILHAIHVSRLAPSSANPASESDDRKISRWRLSSFSVSSCTSALLAATRKWS